MSHGFDDTGSQLPVEPPGGKNNILFILFLIVALVLPPLGIALGLVLMTASVDEPISASRSTRGKSIVIIGILAFVMQVVLAGVFLVPRAVNYLGDQLSQINLQAYPRGGINPSGAKTPREPNDIQILGIMLDSQTNTHYIRSMYDGALEAIENGSKEPIDRYIVASALTYSEFRDEIIEDDDERNDEIERLIRDGLQIDGKRKDVEPVLDYIMLTPLMQTQLEKDNVREAYDLYERLLSSDASAGNRNTVSIIEQWAYNSLFEHWQIRKPHVALDTSLEKLGNLKWESSQPPIRWYAYDYSGGLENVFYLARSLNRTDEFFEIIQNYIDASHKRLTLHSDIAELHMQSGYYCSEIDRWDDALVHLEEAYELYPESDNITYSYAVALYRNGDIEDAAEMVYEACQGPKPLLSLDDIRFLFYDDPEKGVEFLLGKLANDPDEPHLLFNLTILAHRAGNHNLAETACRLKLALFLEVDPDSTHEAARLLSVGDIESAGKLIPIDATENRIINEDYYLDVLLHITEADPEDVALLAGTALKFAPFERDSDLALYDTYFNTMQLIEKVDEAFSHLEHLVSGNPNDLHPRFFLARKLHEAGRLDESLIVLDEMRPLLIAPRWGNMQFLSPEKFRKSRDWIVELNRVNADDVFREMALIYRDKDDMEQYDHYLHLMSVYGRNFESAILVAERLIEKDKLKPAGQILDDLTFFPEVYTQSGEAYDRLMSLYSRLKAAGWVRERDFEPFTHPAPEL